MQCSFHADDISLPPDIMTWLQIIIGHINNPSYLYHVALRDVLWHVCDALCHVPVSSCLGHHTRGRGHQAWANQNPGMGRVANQRAQHEVTCRIFWWHPQPFTSPAEHKKIHTISPEGGRQGRNYWAFNDLCQLSWGLHGNLERIKHREKLLTWEKAC